MSKHQLLAQKVARYLERRLSKHDVNDAGADDGSAQAQLRENEYAQLETDWEAALALAAIGPKPGPSEADADKLGALATRYGIK
jgi:hypothetical protein